MNETKTPAIEPGPQDKEGLAKAVQAVAVLSESRKRDNANDPRPRFKNVDIMILGGRLRFRRLTPEQQLTLSDNMHAAGIVDHNPDVKSDAVREVMAKCVHVGLCPVDSPSLLIPGDEGRKRIKALPDPELLRCWKEAIDFNNIPVWEDE